MLKRLLFVIFLALLPIKAEVLDVKNAFKIGLSSEESGFGIHFDFGEKIYIYKNSFSILLNSQNITQSLDIPQGQDKGSYSIIGDDFSIVLPFKMLKADKNILELNYQGCSAGGVCYRPQQKHFELFQTGAKWQAKEIEKGKKINSKAQALSSEQHIAAQLESLSFWVLVASFFGYGLLLSFTPCVLPMLPILSSIIVSRGARGGAGLASIVYVLAMAGGYALLGLAFSWVGVGIQAALQNIWVLGAFAFIFALLAFSMFGFYDLKLPSRFSLYIQSKGGQGYFGVAVMGLLSTLVISPCVAPPLAGALLYIASSANLFYGAFMLFVMGLGMGVPLLVLGFSARRWLPKPGKWMDMLKACFGFLMLGMSIWLLGRIFGASFMLLGFGVLGVYFAFYFGLAGAGLRSFYRASLALLAFYSALLISGGLAGGGDFLNPLSPFVKDNSASNKASLEFKYVSDLSELKELISSAQKPLMLDVWASWCVSCLELDNFTFKDERVAKKLESFLLVKVDISKQGNDEILKEFSIVGPPSLLFFKDGSEIRQKRVIGYVNADKFLSIIDDI